MSLTILTPTYNRVDKLSRLFESLKNQTNLNFQWLIIDDGSTDKTKEYVNSLINRANFEIKYIYKKNGGKHSAINYSMPYIKKKYVTIVDSDDYLALNAVEYILRTWKKYESNPSIGGITFQKGFDSNTPLDGTIKGECISTFTEATNKGLSGDHFETVRTDLFKEFKFPIFKNEKFVAEGAMWYLITRGYKVVYSSKILYYCEYLEDGYTKQGKKLQFANPKGSRWHAKVLLNNTKFRMPIRLKEAILFCVYSKACGYNLFDTLKSDKNKKYILISWLPADFLSFMWKKKYNL